MTFLFADSFEGYSTMADTAERWNSYGTGASIEPTTVKDGSKSFKSSSTTGYLHYNFATNQNIVYLSFWFRRTATGQSGILWMSEPSLATALALYVNSSDKLQMRSTSGSTTINANQWYHIELKSRIFNSISAGDVEVKLNGTSEFVLPAGTDTTGIGENTTSGFRLSTFHATTNTYYDSLIVWNSINTSDGFNAFIGQLRMQTLYPNGNGNSSQWLGSDGNKTDNYLLVDEGPGDHDGDTSYLEADASSLVDLFAYTNLTASIDSIKGLQSVAAGRRHLNLLPPKYIIPVVRVGGTNYTKSGVVVPSSATYSQQIVGFWNQNPNTASAWTETDVNGAEFGVQGG